MVAKGRVYGPFDTAEEMIASLKANMKKLRATSATFRPASICFSSPMICSSLCQLFFISKLLSSR